MPASCRNFFPAITLSLVSGLLVMPAWAQSTENPLRRRAEVSAPPAQVVQPVAYAEEEAEPAAPVAPQPPREIGSSLARQSRPIQPNYIPNHAQRTPIGGFQPQHLRSRSPSVAQAQYSDGPVGRVMRRWQPQPGQELAAPMTEAQAAPEELPAPMPNPGSSTIVHPEGDYSPTYESGYYEGGPEFGQESCGPGGCYPRPFGANWGRGCVELCFPFPCIVPENLQLLVGAQGYTGPLNRGGESSFGFHEGFNLSLPVWCGLCAQGGATFTQSNREGSVLTDDQRNQTFVTLGLFRRVDWGLQGGIAIDYLHDEWDYEIDLSQIRGEISWQFCCNHEAGFWFSASSETDNVTLREGVVGTAGINFRNVDRTIEVNDLYAFFYRRQLCCGGEGRVFAGFTGSNQGLLGANLSLPINGCWSYQTNFLYIMPEDTVPVNDVVPDYLEESWNLSFNLVWTPFSRSGCGTNYCRPLFGVADNSNFATRIQ